MNEDVTKTERSSPDLMWLLGCGLITAVGVVLRFVDLTLKPLHHDEGVNGWFLTTLYRDGVYHYDPANYHGPTLYYISLAFAKIFGLETTSIRASVAIWGALMVVLTFFLRRYLGTVGSLFAALFLAISPGMVYISRYFIHEIFFVFVSLGVVVSVVYFIEKRRAGVFAIGWTALVLLVCFLPSTLKLASALPTLLNLAPAPDGESSTSVWLFRAGFFIVELILVGFVIRMLLAWNDGRPMYLLLASACAALMFATKETAFITLGTMLIACVSVWIWRKMFKVAEVEDENGISDTNLTWRNFREALGVGWDIPLSAIVVIAVFLFIVVLFFSSFFTYPEGIRGAIDAYAIWTKTGSKDHTQNGTWAYLDWGMHIEAPIFILSAIGMLIAFVKAHHRFAMFVSLWAFGLFAAYSLIPYKTPWLAISFILPMCLTAGYAINELLTSTNLSLKLTGGLLAIGATAVLAYQSYDLNFVHYADEDQVYVYAHTNREFLDLMQKINYYALKSGKNLDAKIEIVSPDYWPMVWYLRNYTQANFHGHMIDSTDGEMIVAKKSDQDDDVVRKFSANYRFVGSYRLRSGVDLVLLVRKDLAEPNAKELYQIPLEPEKK